VVEGEFVVAAHDADAAAVAAGAVLACATWELGMTDLLRGSMIRSAARAARAARG
jgi:hypothetical protein